MKFMWTNSSRKALEEIKKRMIQQYGNNDVNRFKLKFTKKKEFLAVPSPYFNCPSFQLFLNGKLHNSYIFRNNKWTTLD